MTNFEFFSRNFNVIYLNIMLFPGHRVGIVCAAHGQKNPEFLLVVHLSAHFSVGITKM
jgi:hypothetical protein